MSVRKPVEIIRIVRDSIGVSFEEILMWTMRKPRRYDHCALGCPSDLLPDDKWAHLEPLISMAKLRTITSHEVMKRYMRFAARNGNRIDH